MRRLLESITRARHISADFQQRAWIVLLAGQGLTNVAIAQRLRCTETTVRKWRERFRLRPKVTSLFDAPRSGRPSTVPMFVRLELIKIACNPTCATDKDCVSTACCATGICAAKGSIGVACTAPDQCTSGFCADGVCCTTACIGSNCQACASTLTGQPNGTCTNVSAGKDPHADCPGTKCTTGTLTLDACNGAGSCTSTPTLCAPFSCNGAGTACATTCTVDTDCGANGDCASGTCETKGSNSATCTAPNQRTSGFCVDGVCCNHQCTGQCQACAETGNVGNCIAVKGIPRAPRSDCTGTGTSCYGQCDGINIAACAYPSIGESCGTGCVDGQRSICDNAGVGQAPSPRPDNFGCADSTTCSASCVVDSDCAASFVCIAGKCATLPPATCSADGLSSIRAADAGTPQPCSAYRCSSTGACGSSCNATSDCVSGAVCNTAVSPGQCVATGATSSRGGCAVASVGGVGSRSRVVLAGAIALLALRRRRTWSWSFWP